jgi:hypothetical protein
LLAIIVVAVWLLAAALFVATFIASLTLLLFWFDGWPVIAATFLVILVAKSALATSGLRGKELLQFFKGKQTWMFIVQLVLLALMFVLALSIPSGRANGDVCAKTVNGERIELSPGDCRTLRIRTLRFFTEAWMTVGWLGVVQLALARGRQKR